MCTASVSQRLLRQTALRSHFLLKATFGTHCTHMYQGYILFTVIYKADQLHEGGFTVSIQQLY